MLPSEILHFFCVFKVSFSKDLVPIIQGASGKSSRTVRDSLKDTPIETISIMEQKLKSLIIYNISCSRQIVILAFVFFSCNFFRVSRVV